MFALGLDQKLNGDVTRDLMSGSGNGQQEKQHCQKSDGFARHERSSYFATNPAGKILWESTRTTR